MQINGNTIFISGGGSGIGQALAKEFMALGNQVIIGGRRQQALDATTNANPGMQSITFDIEQADLIPGFAEQLTRQYPALNTVIHCAGIMRPEQLKDAATNDAEVTVTTNLLGPIRLTAALLPHLLAQPRATIMTVSSGLAFVPMALTPTYCATKAAIHSYSQSLRYQLRDTAIQVIELVPPYVQTELMGQRQANDPRAMPLSDFIAETMLILKNSPEATEVLVQRVNELRFAESNGDYDEYFRKFNDAVMAAASGH